MFRTSVMGNTSVAVDALARWHRQGGDDTWMLTGTDEHGQKMLRAAAANNVTPQEWVDKLVTESWFPLLKTLDVANDDFIRTTQERHETNVQTFFQRQPAVPAGGAERLSHARDVRAAT